jgi:hypothetical protein
MKEFLVVYDYGSGGVWGIAIASSEKEISQHFPDLQVVPDRPEWMDDEMVGRIRDESFFVLDDPSTYPEWLRVLDEGR